MEVWKDIEEFPGYQVSSLGNVRSKGKLLKPYNCKKNYLSVGLCKDGKRRIVKVHRLVMEAFHGRSDLSVDHINGNSLDNKLCNLRYLSSKENTSIARKGRKCSNTKLKKVDVIQIKQLLQTRKKTQPEIALQFSVSLRTVEYISSGKTWKNTV
ncbi:NUMOD4 motif-containing HNH endonuclease [Pleurocapsa sp. FMAR1]|uniref:NUMOD4 motif-containing HNH endonuclease n=1 Tax=Pleurocapsa sp. FMAR1 TaxID=3040204 RepID=UPI0029C95EAE|nr:NUMOD4 motif-containing HNH endonuclease [Pleurocapsa sp. FMAR1]